MATRSTPWLAGLALAVACGCLALLLVDSGRDSSPEVQAPAETAKGDASEAAGGGDTGSQGVAGTTGSAGLPEAVIAEGPAGPRGRTGEAGPAGTAGPAGSAGATGPQGCEGPEGPAGPVGETGPQGCEGPVGAPGAPGPAGPQGTAGADGKTILNGSGPPSDEEGAEGDFYIDTTASEIYGPKTGSGWGAGTSEVGPAGSSVLSGTGPPGASLGADGDFYIDTSVNSIYGPKASGAWGVSVPLVGPQGPAGATGPEGPQGVQGPPGVDAANVPLYRGSFYSTGDQSPSGGTNVVPINLDETDISQGVDLVNPGSASVRVVHAGTYNFQFSAQVTKTDSGTDVLYIWPQVDRDGAGATYSWEDVTWSNSSITLFAKDDRNIAAWNFVLPVDDGAYFRMVMSSANTGFLIDSVTSPPVGPALPGMILTVTRAG